MYVQLTPCLRRLTSVTRCLFGLCAICSSNGCRESEGYSYSRTNNPPVTVLEQKLAKLENGHLGANSLSDFLTFLALLGGNRVINHNKYGNVVNLMPQAYHLGMIFDICGNWGWFIVGFTAPAAMVSCNIHPRTQGETEVFSSAPDELVQKY